MRWRPGWPSRSPARRRASRAQETQIFARAPVTLEFELADVLPVDLDDDGRDELVVVEAERGSSRDEPHWVRVYRHTDTGFALLEAARRALPLHIRLLGVGHFRDGPALVLLVPGRIEVWPWRGTRFAPDPARTVPVESVFPVPGGRLQGAKWLHDLSGDGYTEILVPRFDGLQVLVETAAGRLERRGLLRFRARGRLQSWFRKQRIAYDMPHVAALQVDGKGWRDLAVYLNGLLWVFLLEPQQRGAVAAAYTVDFTPPRPFDPKAPREPPLLLVAAHDLNRDGHFDLVFSRNTAADSQFNTRTAVLIHYGASGTDGAPIAFSTEPAQAYFSEGFSLPMLLDVNADQRRDLLLVNVEIGFWNVIRALITRTVNAQAAFYLMPPAGQYPQTPQHLVHYDVTFSLGRFSHQPITAFADVNGDTLPDLLLSVDQETIGIHWGRPGGVWDDDPDEEWEDAMPINGKRVRVADLDRDGREDLLLLYDRDDMRAMPQVQGRFTVLHSRVPATAAGSAAAPTGAATGLDDESAR